MNPVNLRIGVMSLVSKLMIYLTMGWLRLVLFFVLRDNPAQDPVLTVSYYKQYGYIQFQVLDISRLRSPATQQAPEQLQ